MSEWKFFSPQGKLYKFLDTIGNLIIWNFMWLLCSLPIVTIGVSTIALYQINFRQIENKGFSCLDFFKYFKDNFKLGVYGELLFVAVILLGFSWMKLFQSADIHFGLTILVYAIFLIIFTILSYLLPTAAYFSGCFKQLIKISLYLAFRMPVYFMAKVIILLLPIVVFWGMKNAYATGLFPVLFLLCFSGINWINAKLYLNILKKQNFAKKLYEEQEESEE